ncbi:hypothetical protein GM1_002_01510 [Gordonia malaquae NBRC 108250]|uniref:Uncharacterized protein n=1 Tax=Gordonia malaquae NBRC 108250 TaxID=1223542 RepID=M3V9R2_GORML|nr:hypothetical protein GM1_002_01510 [Gordonia malaquae NBRC 108250]
MLPQRGVGHLYRQRPELGDGAFDARRVCGEQIDHQRAHRLAVGRDVVEDREDDVLIVGHPLYADADRAVDGHVEAGGRGCGELISGVDEREVEFIECGGRIADLLDGRPVDGGEYGSQHLVPLDHVREGTTQCDEVESTGHPQRDRHVVRGRRRIELVDEPHALLLERQRDHRGTRIDGRHRGQCLGRRRGDRDEVANARSVEDVPDRHLCPECFRDARRQPHRGERVAAEVEERLGDGHRRDAEEFGEDRGDCLFLRAVGGDALRC